MEVIRHDITLKEGQELVIAPIGDIQWAGDKDAIAYQHLVRHLKRCRKLKAWYLGMGDYTDFASPSNRQTLRSGKLYDTARQVIAEKAQALTDEVEALLLRSTRGRWLGLLSGHHFYPMTGWGNTDAYLADALHAPYLGTCGLVELVITADVGWAQAQRSLWLWCHHGNGNGGIGYGLRKLEQMASGWDVDIMVMAHVTKLSAAPLDRIMAGGGDHKRMTLVVNGGWTKGYRVGHTEYPEAGMYRPVCLGNSLIRIWPWIDENGELQLEHRAEV